jgi:hypothetical protein
MLCHSCRCHVDPSPPKTAWKIATMAFWISASVVAILFSIPIGLNLVLAPAAIVVGMAIGTAARRMSSWTCPECHAELVEPEPQTEVVGPAFVRGTLRQLAHAS